MHNCSDKSRKKKKGTQTKTRNEQTKKRAIKAHGQCLESPNPITKSKRNVWLAFVLWDCWNSV